MNETLDEMLARVAAENFESLVFMLLMSEAEAPPAETDSPAVAASVAFAGPFQGILFLTVSGEVLRALAGNMLGLEGGEGPRLDQQHDALKELLNVICGNLLPEIAGREAVFTVHAPELLACPRIPRACDHRPPAAEARLILDEGTAEVALFADERLVAACRQGTAATG